MPISLPYAVDVLTNWKSLLIFLFVEFTFGAVSEELGWRGYALDELQTRWNALTSSLVLGLVWGFWHTPAFLIPGLSQHEMGGIFSWNYVAFLAMPVMGSILHTWIYNNTGRSILVAGILMHFMQNALVIFLGGIFDSFKMPPAYYAVLAVVLGLVSILVVIVWGPETLARRPVDRLSHLVQRTT
jgi:membrane protease YdiL (CAAX protease family)